jgi:hypothetical protein
MPWSRNEAFIIAWAAGRPARLGDAAAMRSRASSTAVLAVAMSLIVLFMSGCPFAFSA